MVYLFPTQGRAQLEPEDAGVAEAAGAAPGSGALASSSVPLLGENPGEKGGQQ